MTSAKKTLLITAVLTLGVTSAASARSPWGGDPGGWYQHGSSSGYGQRNRGRGYNDWFGGGRNNAWGDAFGDAMSDVVGDFFGDAEFDMEFKIRANARGKGKGKGKGRGRGDARGYSQGRGYSRGQYQGNYYGNGYYDSRAWGGPSYNRYSPRYPY